MKRTIITLMIMLILPFCSFAQENQEQDGYWDYQRVIEKNILVTNGESKVVSVQLPEGTTQIIYRITYLSPNEAISDNLSTVLANIPSGYAKGAAAAMSLLKTIGGDNKGRYHIFINNQDASNYVSTQVANNACYSSQKDIPGEKNFMTMNDLYGCMKEDTRLLYFTFFNGNYVYDEKVVFELMPWVDKKASRGWTLELKENLQKFCVADFPELTKPNEVCNCIIEKFQENYKKQDLQQFTDEELLKILNSFKNNCADETGENENQFDILRKNAVLAANENNFSTAIINYLQIINGGNATAIDYNNLGYYYLLTKQYLKALKYLKEAETKDETDLLIKGNLAHAYLLNGEIDKAKELYVKFKDQNINEEMSWYQMVVSDFDTFKSKGIISTNYEIILNLIK